MQENETMVCDGPTWWLPYVQPFGTLLLGVGAAFLAFRQWQTARDKLVLDLFERRMAVLDKMQDAVGPILSDGIQACNSTMRQSFSAQLSKARFLFGPDVIQFMAEVNDTIRQLEYVHKRQRSPYTSEDESHLLNSKEDNGRRVVEAFFLEFPNLVEPYVLMNHKLSSYSLPAKVAAYCARWWVVQRGHVRDLARRTWRQPKI